VILISHCPTWDSEWPSFVLSGWSLNRRDTAVTYKTNTDKIDEISAGRQQSFMEQNPISTATGLQVRRQMYFMSLMH